MSLDLSSKSLEQQEIYATVILYWLKGAHRSVRCFVVELEGKAFLYPFLLTSVGIAVQLCQSARNMDMLMHQIFLSTYATHSPLPPPEISKQDLNVGGDEHVEVSKNQSKIACNSMLEWQICPWNRIKCSNNLFFYIVYGNDFTAVALILIGPVWCLLGDT